MAELRVNVTRLVDHAVLPARATPGSVGYDLCASHDSKIPPGGKGLIGTGLAMAIPYGCYGRIAPRSSLAWINHVDVGAGVVDPDYTGEVKVLLYNLDRSHHFEVHAGDRIAQLVVERVALPEMVEVDELDATDRGDGGFGSTPDHHK